MPDAPIPRLLIVDDESAQMKALCQTLEPEGFSTTGFSSANQALATLRNQSFDLVLTDLMMPEMDGIALLRAAFEIDPDLVGIVMTGHGTVGTAVDALKTGALDYILKPFRLSAVLPVLNRALAVRRLRMENIQLREAVGIYELSMAIALALDFETVLEKVGDAVFQQSQASELSIWLPARDGKEMRAALARGPHAAQVRDQRMPASAALSAWVARSRELLAKPDELAEIQSAFVAPIPEIGTGISLPMLTGGRLIGILNFVPASPQRLIALGQIKALNILASTAASALEASSLLEQLRAAEQRYRHLAEDAPDIVFRYEVDPQRRFSYVNPAVTELTGYSPDEYYVDPDLGLKIVHADDRPFMETVLRGGYVSGSTITMRWVTKGGATIWIEQRNVLVRNTRGSLVAIEGIARDITERKNLEEQLRHAQKMEAIGRLTAGVAHDFNNLLTVINGYSDLTIKEVPPEGSVRRKIDHVKKAGEQAAALTRQLLAFGRKQISQPRVLDVNAIVKNNLGILRRLIGEDIEIVTTLDSCAALVQADEGQIEQLLLNLAVNSRDAMAQGGRLAIETTNLTLDEVEARQFAAGGAGPYVMLSVTDTGCGMDQATQARVFEPFFTTKELGRGTGLGLSIVYGIVKQSGGNICLESDLGKGTTFRIYLRRLEGERAIPESYLVPGQVYGGVETILVVEDDAAVRQLVCTILQEAGYQVLRARHGNDALQICQQHDGMIDLVLTDLVMPQMSGPALAEKLRNFNPSIRIVYTSGYADDTVLRQGGLDPNIPMIQKPFRSGMLLQKIREVLDSSEPNEMAGSRVRGSDQP